MSNPFPKFIRKETKYEAEWGSECICYTHKPNLVEYFRTYRPHGLSFQGIWVVANVMDDQGTKYNLFRQYKVFDTTMTLSSKEVLGLSSNPEVLFRPGEMYIGRCSHELDEAFGSIEVKPFLAKPNAFRITVKPQRVEWIDADGRLDFKFEALAPAMEYYCPGQWQDAMYRSEPFHVTGTLDGRHVSGFGVVDCAWGPVGFDFVQCKIFRLLEEHWIIWMNVFEDGSIESGVFVSGKGKFQCCYYNVNGDAAITSDNRLDVQYTKDNFIGGATMKMGPHVFRFVSESKIAQVPSNVTWASGRVVREGETRRVKQAFSWFEYFPIA